MCFVLLVSLYHGVYLCGGVCISEARFPVLVEDICRIFFGLVRGLAKHRELGAGVFVFHGRLGALSS